LNRRALSILALAAAVGAVGAVPAAAGAQTTIGLTAGANFATFGGKDASEAEDELGRRTGVRIGAFAHVPLGLVLTFRPELVYSQRGAEYVPDGGGTATAKLDYLEVPLLFRIGMPGSGLGLHALAGPTLSFELQCEGSVGCTESGTKSFIVGGQVGAGIDLPVPVFLLSVDGRYTFGLESFSEDEADDVKHRLWSVTVSAGFPLGVGM
jgi:hypothetical protein